MQWLRRFLRHLPQKRPKANKVRREKLEAYASAMARDVRKLLCYPEPHLERVLTIEGRIESMMVQQCPDPLDCIVIVLKAPRDNLILENAKLYMEEYQRNHPMPGTFLKQLVFEETGVIK